MSTGNPGSPAAAPIFADPTLANRRIPLVELERTVMQLRRRKQSGSLILQRAFRSEMTWPEAAQSRLVESVLVRLPLPTIYVSEARDGNMHIVDGLQRLLALFRFLDGELALEGLGLLPELNGKRIDAFESRLRRRYEDAPVAVMVLGVDADPRLFVDLFDRLNGGAPLREEEARRFLDQKAS